MDSLKNYPKKKVYVYFPTVQFTENTGTINLNKYQFDKLLRLLIREYGKYTKLCELYYNYYNKKYVIINGCDKKLLQIDTFDTIIEKNIIYNIVTETEIDINKFPIIDKYHNIVKKNIMEYKVNDYSIQMITESYPNDKTIYYIQIHFINNSDSNDKLHEIIKFIQLNMS